MDCRKFRNQLESESLQPQDRLDTELLEHLDSCQACRDEFKQFQDAWSMLPASLPQPTISDDLESRVMDRVIKSPEPASEYSSRAVFWKYALATSILIGLVSLTWLQPGVFDPEPNAEIARLKELAKQTEELDILKDRFASLTLKYVALSSEQDTGGPSGFLVHDETSRQAHFFGNKLATVDGTSLWVWLLDDNETVLSSSEIETREQSRVCMALLPLENGELVRTLLVTHESTDSPESPSSIEVIRCEIAF